MRGEVGSINERRGGNEGKKEKKTRGRETQERKTVEHAGKRKGDRNNRETRK